MKWLFGTVLFVLLAVSFFVFPIAEIAYGYGGIFGWIILLSVYAVLFGVGLKIFEAVSPPHPAVSPPHPVERTDMRRGNSN